ncbi:FGGY family carbohydrate kinase [Pueribacillus sp. YX66]|uniref:FGGY family carbohydrate kinase n=1 Tax=Pueribacillus sp. YX66 TaxID=3229242 RepID=UPI00358CFDFA
MQKKFILAIDAGTTGIRTVLYRHDSTQVAYTYQKITQFTPQPGWLEHDPMEIYETIVHLIKTTCKQANITSDDIAAIGIATQRGTTVAWSQATGKPIHRAIVWQDLRTVERCTELTKLIGIDINPNSAFTKYEWLLNNIPNCRERVVTGDVLIGTLDSWLVWKLTGGQAFITDVSNAVVTTMWNPVLGKWSPELASLIQMPVDKLATIKPSSTIYGFTAIPEMNSKVPITAISGDQQAAMFGHLATEPGNGKATYGTSVMVNVNTGKQWVFAKKGCYSLALWRMHNVDTFCLEGTVITGGAAIEWANDLRLFDSPEECVKLAESVPHSGGVFFIPALQGLGTPYRKPEASGALLGLSRSTTKAHIARAILEGIAFRTRQVVETIKENSPVALFDTLRVDGGIAKSDFFLQLQANVLGIPVERANTVQVTSLGVAYMAGLAVDYWKSIEEIKAMKSTSAIFTPDDNRTNVEKQFDIWTTLINSVTSIHLTETEIS